MVTPNAALDMIGVAAGLAGATSMACGTVLTRKWKPPVSLLTITAWQLTAGGLLLLPVAFVADVPVPVLSATNLFGLAWLALIGAALTYSVIAPRAPLSVRRRGAATAKPRPTRGEPEKQWAAR